MRRALCVALDALIPIGLAVRLGARLASAAMLAERAGAARLAAKLRLGAGVGGGLDLATRGPLLHAAPSPEWVSAGREVAERALLVGIERTVRDWRERL